MADVCGERSRLPLHRDFLGTVPQVRIAFAEPQAVFGDGLLRWLYHVQHLREREPRTAAIWKNRNVCNLRISEFCAWRSRLCCRTLPHGFQPLNLFVKICEQTYSIETLDVFCSIGPMLVVGNKITFLK